MIKSSNLVLMLALGHTIDDSRVYHRMAKSISKICRVELIALKAEVSDFGQNEIRLHTVEGSRIKQVVTALRLIKKMRPDLIHCHDPKSVMVGVTYRLLRRKTKMVFDVHELYETYPTASSRRFTISFLLHRVVIPFLEKFFVDGFILCVPKQKERYGRSSKPVEIIYNFPALDDIDNLSALSSKSIEKQYLLIYEGRIAQARGVFQYLDIVKELKREVPDLKLALVGPIQGDASEVEIRHYIETNSLSENVIMTGAIPYSGVGKYLATSRIGLNLLAKSPNNNHGIQRKVFEYMACGIPILGSRNLVYFREFVVNKGCGLAVEFDDPGEAVKAIKQMLQNYSSFHSNCVRTIKSYCWASEEKKLFSFYEKVT